MENINMNGLKIDNMNNANAVNAPDNAVKINPNVEDTLKDTPESTTETAQESTAKSSNKHVVVYIGSSEFTDSTGHKWHRNDEKTYDESEYINRSDLHFMVKYGEMKHTVVSV